MADQSSTPVAEPATSSVVSAQFISQARNFLKTEYLPKIERCLERLSDEQIWWRANQESNSIGNLVLHLCGNARQWIVCGLGLETDKRERQKEFDQRDAIAKEKLLALLSSTISEVDQTLAQFDNSKLLDNFQIQGTEVDALGAIFHVTEHFSMHTGQIIMLTKMLTGTDLVFYDFSSGKPDHTWQ